MNWQSSNVQCSFFLSQDVKENVLLSSRPLEKNNHQSRSKKRGLFRWKKKKFFITLFEHLENEKCFLNEIKSNFYNFLRAAVWGKIKK